VEADETFFQPVQEAATEWSAATGMSFLVVSVPAGSEWHDGTWRVESEAVAPHLAGTGWRAENPEPLTAHIGIDPAIVAGFGFTEDELRRAMLHEFGHALGLRFAGGDLHYEGPLPSVMYSGLRDGPNCSLHLGTPELDAWDVASPAFPRTAR
jgi:hypothetical protein